jgi:putative endonuclease
MKHDHCFCTGCSGDARERLAQHEAGGMPFTSEHGFLKLFYYEASLSKADAFQREKYLKTTYGKRYNRNRCTNYFTG